MSELSYYAIKPIRNYFEKLLKGYSIEIFPYGRDSMIYVLNDSLVILFEVSENVVSYLNNQGKTREELTSNEYIEPGIYGNKCYSIRIVELTYNELGFKFNNENFKRTIRQVIDFNSPYLAITFERFKGYTRLYWCLDVPTDAERVNLEIPELRLRERYESWEGVNYYFIYLELQAADNSISKAVAYTTSKPDNYINSLCRKITKTGKFTGESIRAGDDGYNWVLMQKSFDSWKGIKLYKRLEDNLTYFYTQGYYREKDDVWRKAVSLVKEFYEGADQFVDIKRSTWLKPINKWISEELVYNLCKKIYKEYQVIYQMRPFFLRSSSGGQMSYDVFISEINVAVEYQGKQHFEPVDFFGGEESFLRQIERDKEKIKLSKENGIKLVYINYDDVISKELIRDRINEILDRVGSVQ